jgi:hypothetical protein
VEGRGKDLKVLGTPGTTQGVVEEEPDSTVSIVEDERDKVEVEVGMAEVEVKA